MKQERPNRESESGNPYLSPIRRKIIERIAITIFTLWGAFSISRENQNIKQIKVIDVLRQSKGNDDSLIPSEAMELLADLERGEESELWDIGQMPYGDWVTYSKRYGESQRAILHALQEEKSHQDHEFE